MQFFTYFYRWKDEFVHRSIMSDISMKISPQLLVVKSRQAKPDESIGYISRCKKYVFFTKSSVQVHCINPVELYKLFGSLIERTETTERTETYQTDQMDKFEKLENLDKFDKFDKLKKSENSKFSKFSNFSDFPSFSDFSGEIYKTLILDDFSSDSLKNFLKDLEQLSKFHKLRRKIELELELAEVVARQISIPPDTEFICFSDTHGDIFQLQLGILLHQKSGIPTIEAGDIYNIRNDLWTGSESFSNKDLELRNKISRFLVDLAMKKSRYFFVLNGNHDNFSDLHDVRILAISRNKQIIFQHAFISAEDEVDVKQRKVRRIFGNLKTEKNEKNLKTENNEKNKNDNKDEKFSQLKIGLREFRHPKTENDKKTSRTSQTDKNDKNNNNEKSEVVEKIEKIEGIKEVKQITQMKMNKNKELSQTSIGSALYSYSSRKDAKDETDTKDKEILAEKFSDKSNSSEESLFDLSNPSVSFDLSDLSDFIQYGKYKLYFYESPHEHIHYHHTLVSSTSLTSLTSLTSGKERLEKTKPEARFLIDKRMKEMILDKFEDLQYEYNPYVICGHDHMQMLIPINCMNSFAFPFRFIPKKKYTVADISDMSKCDIFHRIISTDGLAISFWNEKTEKKNKSDISNNINSMNSMNNIKLNLAIKISSVFNEDKKTEKKTENHKNEKTEKN